MKKLEKVLSSLTDEQKQLLRDMRKGFYGAGMAKFLSEDGEMNESAAVMYEIKDSNEIVFFDKVLETEGIECFLSRTAACETRGKEFVFVKWDFRNEFFGFLFNKDNN